jgi:hypothetical protein
MRFNASGNGPQNNGPQNNGPQNNGPKINDPEIVAELEALYPQYETALVTNDADTLTRMFWTSPHAMRFGLAENLYGIGEIAAFRKGRSPANLARTVRGDWTS